MAESTDARHLNFDTLDSLWSNTAPILLPIPGNPACQLRLEPTERRLTLITPYSYPEPDVSKLKNISFSSLLSDGDELAEISVYVDGNIRGAYGLVASIVDEIQIEGLSLASAVATSVTRHRGVFTSRASMPLERELGLYGELLFLEFLINSVGPHSGISAWLGPWSEEHDFSFSDVSLEVKTTSSERRRHFIHGFGQLVPTGHKPLSLVSIQVTRTNKDSGRSLPQLVSDVRSSSKGHRAQLDERLVLWGWDDDSIDLYPTVWVLRSTPAAFDVDVTFPKITLESIASSASNSALIADLSYTVDLTSVKTGTLPERLRLFTTKESAL